MIERAQTQDEIEAEEAEQLEIEEREAAERRRRADPWALQPLKKLEQLSPPKVSDDEMCRHLARLIRQFLFGKTLAEIEADMAENGVERAEKPNASVHAAALKKLESIADEMDPIPKPKVMTPAEISHAKAIERIEAMTRSMMPRPRGFRH